jgi:hypothetical protein
MIFLNARTIATGGVGVGDRVLKIDGKACGEQTNDLSPFSGEVGSMVTIELQPPKGGAYVVHLVREPSCQLGALSKCGFPAGTSVSIAHIVDKKGAAEILCLTVTVRTSEDEVMTEQSGEDRRQVSKGEPV